jgi:hypothetical protein
MEQSAILTLITYISGVLFTISANDNKYEQEGIELIYL